MDNVRGLPSTRPQPYDPSLLWIKRQCARWMLNLYEFEPVLNHYFFICYDWMTNGLSDLAITLKKNIKIPVGRKKEYVEARKAMDLLLAARGRNLCHKLEDLFDDYPFLQTPMREQIYFSLEEWHSLQKGKVKTIFPRGFKSLFNLDDDALNLCSYAWGLGNFRAMETYFEDEVRLNTLDKAPMLAYSLGMSSARLASLRKHLTKLGIIEYDNGEMLRVSDNINLFLTGGSTEGVESFFCKSLPRTEIPIEQFQIGSEEKRHALNLMGHKGSSPAHLLLYGAPGTGKTSFASQLVQQLNVKAWSVTCNETDSTKDRRVSLIACLNLAALHPGSIIVVDEAEKILDTSFEDTHTTSTKAWLNELLEKKNIRIIWITNQIEHIDQAVRRRFSFSIHFQPLGIRESIQMWNNVACRLKLANRFPVETQERFAQSYPVPVAVMENVAKQAKALAGRNDFCDCAELILKSHMQLSNDGYWQEKTRTQQENYEIRAVCTTLEPDRLLSRIKTLHSRISGHNYPGMGNILFYGPPGTGKTALAHHLAEQLDMECLEERASDILGSYVGETERNIANAFHRAQQKKALLLIDEVDSFLFNRESASRSWEKTMVNEFLTALQGNCNLCICTTNFRSIIDCAAMRRFPFKVEFCYASPERLLLLYDNLLSPLTLEKMDEQHKEQLCAQKYLTPGDFKTVLSQFWLEEPENVTCDQLIKALIREQKLKLDNETKTIGFH